MNDHESRAPDAELAEGVRRFVTRLSPEPVCDACVAERLPGADAEAVALHVAELAGSSGFERTRGPCSLCGIDKPVIRKL